MRTPRLLGALGLAAVLAVTPARAADVDLLLPNDADGVATLNIRVLLETSFGKKYAEELVKQLLEDQPRVQGLFTELNFDPLRDLDRVIAASSPGEGDRRLAIFRGKFDVAKIEAKGDEVAKDRSDLLKIHKVPNGAGGQYTIYEVMKTPAPEGQRVVWKDKPAYVAVAGKDTMVVSSAKDMVIDALDKATGRKKGEPKSKDLKALIEKANSKQTLWLALLPGALARAVPGGDDAAIKEYLDKIDGVSGGVTVEEDIRMELLISAKTAAQAKELSDTFSEVLNMGIGAISIMAGRNKQLMPAIDVLKTIRASDKDKLVVIKGAITQEILEKAAKQQPKKQ